ncbi:AAA-family ATPase [Fragilaria crotonensis]|nr:AAA-family ATPase [Fragilaria crotonensis]
MGRKRNKGPSLSASQSSSLRQDEIIHSLKMTFLELIGISGSSSNNNNLSMDPTSHSVDESRIRLVETLRAFASQKQIYDTNNNNTGNNNGNNLIINHEFLYDENNLERLESTARQLRTDLSNFSEYLKVEREEVFHVYRELQVTIHPTVPPSTSPLQTSLLFDAGEELVVLESIYRAYLLQIAQEERILKHIVNTLDALYSDTAASKNSNHLQVWIRQLSDRSFLTKDTLRLFLKSSSLTPEESVNHVLPIDILDADKAPSQEILSIEPESCSQQVCIPPLVLHSTCTNALDAARAFVFASPTAPNTAILIVGPSGSGKTFICNEIEQFVARHIPRVIVIRPKIPVDFMGPRVGDPERSLQSLFMAAAANAKAQSSNSKCVVILDDIHFLLGSGDDDSQAPTNQRFRLDFLSHLDQFNHPIGSAARPNYSNNNNINTLILCTSSTPLYDELGRFTKSFTLDQHPSREERMAMIKTCLGIVIPTAVDDDVSQRLGVDHDEHSMAHKIGTLTTCLVGRSRAEIAQYCRKAMQRSLTMEKTTTRTTLATAENQVTARHHLLVESMITELSQLTPESLRSGVLDSFVDMTVISAADLRPVDTDKDHMSLPLFGDGMEDAWRQLEALIVTPLCRSDALDKMLFGGSGTPNSSTSSNRRSFCGGVLLTGPAGTGKSTLALHAARVASMYLPSIKVLNVSCTSLVHKEVGGSERALRHLFMAVRAAAPCILLMDNIENIAAVRGKDNTTHGTMDRVLSTLLTELDGVDSNTTLLQKKEGAKFAMIGITHQVSWIDTALRRPGRLEKTIELKMPNREARKKIAWNELQRFDLAENLNLDDLSCRIADHTREKTAADIVALCEDARMASVRETIRRLEVEQIDCSGKQHQLTHAHFASVFANET